MVLYDKFEIPNMSYIRYQSGHSLAGQFFIKCQIQVHFMISKLTFKEQITKYNTTSI